MARECECDGCDDYLLPHRQNHHWFVYTVKTKDAEGRVVHETEGTVCHQVFCPECWVEIVVFSEESDEWHTE